MANPKQHVLRVFRRLFRSDDELPKLVLLGLVVGVLTSLIIILFRFMFEWPLSALLPGAESENFEKLPSYLHFVIPAIGGVVIGLFLLLFKAEHRVTGVAHVMERMNYHEGKLRIKNAIVQFFGGILAIIFGESAGREGPAVHLGSAAGSLLGQSMNLSNSNLRILVGCGSAAAIAASFNTPMAGVIFAMEVILLEYTVAGFTPIIISSVVAAMMASNFYSAELMFVVPSEIKIESMNEIPFILLFSFAIGAMGALFSRTLIGMQRFHQHSIMLRMVAAGLLTGTIAWFFPQIMGLGNDTISTILNNNQFTINFLLAIAFAKLFATAMAVGLGMPMGLISPTLFIGAGLGGALGLLATELTGEPVSDIGFYAILGMGAMMSAVLQAPLAALIALLELTSNPNIILPGMLVIVIANITCSHIFRQSSVFVRVLQIKGLDHQPKRGL